MSSGIFLLEVIVKKLPEIIKNFSRDGIGHQIKEVLSNVKDAQLDSSGILTFFENFVLS